APFPFVIATPRSTQLYTLSLHDALPISRALGRSRLRGRRQRRQTAVRRIDDERGAAVRQVTRAGIPPVRPGGVVGGLLTLNRLRSEEHTSELQSLRQLVCRLLLEKKKTE